MEFQVLGPLEVVEDGRSLRLGSRKQRALLALLLLRAGEVVARDWLIEELWHGQPPAAAEASVHAYVSRLRSVLGASRLHTRSPGYALVLAPEELDSNRFERLVVEGRAVLAQARPGEAARRLGEGLALWRGDAFADFVYEPFAQAEIARLAELRLEALEERAEAELQLGGYEALVAELEALVAAHPLRERMCRQLMVALYRSGRQAEALAAYAKVRRVLVQELGLEPGLELRALQRAILRQDESLAPLPGALEVVTREARKTITVLAIVVGGTANDPETERAFAERVLARSAPVLARHGGHVKRHLGAQLLAVFGIPRLRLPGGSGDVGGDDVGGVPVQRDPGPVVADRGSRVGVRGRFLDVAQRDAASKLVESNVPAMLNTSAGAGTGGGYSPWLVITSAGEAGGIAVPVCSGLVCPVDGCSRG